jgi:hypothetical protein
MAGRLNEVHRISFALGQFASLRQETERMFGQSASVAEDRQGHSPKRWLVRLSAAEDTTGSMASPAFGAVRRVRQRDWDLRSVRFVVRSQRLAGKPRRLAVFRRSPD